MYNIKQVNSHNLNDCNSIIKKGVKVYSQELDIVEEKDILYKEINSDKLESSKVIKFGFCMNTVSGIGIPFYINELDETHKFYLGKTGIYEFQPEDYRNINEGTEVETAIYPVSSFYLPYAILDENENIVVGFEFVLDYCY